MKSEGKPAPKREVVGARAKKRTVLMGSNDLDALARNMPDQVGDVFGSEPDELDLLADQVEDEALQMSSRQDFSGIDVLGALDALDQQADPDLLVDEQEPSDVADTHALGRTDPVLPPDQLDWKLDSFEDESQSLCDEDGSQTSVSNIGAMASIHEISQSDFATDSAPEIEAEQDRLAESRLGQVNEMPQPSLHGPVIGAEGVLVGFLASFKNDPCGAFIELRSGRLVVSSEPVLVGASLVIDHPSVSPMHALLRIEERGTVHVLDQMSEHGTQVRRGGGAVETLSGSKSVLRHGDVVAFGDCSYHVCLIAHDLHESE